MKNTSLLAWKQTSACNWLMEISTYPCAVTANRAALLEKGNKLGHPVCTRCSSSQHLELPCVIPQDPLRASPSPATLQRLRM